MKVSYTTPLLSLSLALLFINCPSFIQAYDKEALAGWFMGLKPEKVVYAVNCGSNELLTDMQGVTYKAVMIAYLRCIG